MHKASKIIFIVLSILTGITFIYSAYTKADPIQPFEYTIVEYIRLPWLLAAITARFIIGLEAALGIMICCHFFGYRNVVLKVACALVVVMSVYLIGLWVVAGNNVNCGCFGDAIWLSPSASLIKNAVLLIVLGLLARFHRGIATRWAGIAGTVIFCTLLALPFVIYSIPGSQPTWLHKDRYKTDLSFLSATDSAGRKMGVAIDLNTGRHIVAFLSQACPHCRIAAYKMHVMKLHNPHFPFFLVIGGTTSDLSDFWKKTKADDIPYTRLEKNAFLNYTGGEFPKIIWVNNGWVEARADYNTLTESDIAAWLNQK